MGVVCSILLLLFGAVWYHVNKNKQMKFQGLNKKEHPLRVFYDVSHFLYSRFPLLFQRRDETLRKGLRNLQVVTKEQLEQKVVLFRCRQISFFLVFFLGGCLLTVLLSFTEKEESLFIERNPTGKGEKQVELILKNEDSKEPYSLLVDEKQYTEAEWMQKRDEAFSYIEQKIKGKNISFDEVCDSLVFPKKIPNSGIKVSYTTDALTVIDEGGKVNTSEVPKTGQLVNVFVKLQYREWKEEREYPIRVIPKKKTKEEQQYEMAIETLKEEEKKEPFKTGFQLPKEVGSYTVEVLENQQVKGYVILIFCIGVGALFFYREEDNMKSQLKERREQLLKEYPEFIHQLVLLIGAGMTLKSAFQRIGENYKAKKRKTEEETYLYEELLASLYELQAGIAEEEVYREFGNRLGLPVYKRMMELLIQGLKKGIRNTIFLLEQEERNSLEMRKEQAKRLGEEAGTKLLMPMILLLVVILVLVLYPAMMQFQVY